MESLRIICLCVAAAIAYGMLHDLVTAHVCVEYFTIGHPPVFDTESPVLLALGWGVIATWWVGLPLGALLAVAARTTAWPKRSARSLVKPLVTLLLVMGILALIAGMIGFTSARRGSVWLLEPLASRVPHDRHARFLGDAFAHTTSYAAGFLGGLVLCGYIVWSRARASRQVGH